MTSRRALLPFIVLVVLSCAFPSFQAFGNPTRTRAAQALTPTSPPLATIAPLVAVAPDPALAKPAGALARIHVAALSQAIGKRVAGTAYELKAAQYIESAFKQAGYDCTWQQFAYTAVRGTLSLSLKSNNIIAVKPGQSRKEIIIGAHYDTFGESVGADDNASGVGVMLELAARLQQVQTPYTIRFIAFGAEEDGGKGSRYYANNMTNVEVENTVAMINLDTLAAGNFAYIYGSYGADGKVRDWALADAKKHNWDLVTQPGENKNYPAGDTGDWSDFVAFEQLGIQYAYGESTDWHLGQKDGRVQVDEKLGDRGVIANTKYDSLDYIDRSIPGRMDQRLSLYVNVMQDILTQYR